MCQDRPSRPTVKAEQPERTWLTEVEFKTFTDTFMAENSRDLLRVMVGTGLRFGEITALWVEDIDLVTRTLIVRKAWNRQGEDGDTQIPKLLTKRISAKHEMRGHCRHPQDIEVTARGWNDRPDRSRQR